MASSSPEEVLKTLRERAAELERRRQRVNYAIELAQKELAQLKAQARERYGTDDPAALRDLLAKLEAENRRALEEAEEALAQWARRIAEAEAVFE